MPTTNPFHAYETPPPPATHNAAQSTATPYQYNTLPIPIPVPMHPSPPASASIPASIPSPATPGLHPVQQGGAGSTVSHIPDTVGALQRKETPEITCLYGYPISCSGTWLDSGAEAGYTAKQYTSRDIFNQCGAHGVRVEVRETGYTAGTGQYSGRGRKLITSTYCPINLGFWRFGLDGR